MNHALGRLTSSLELKRAICARPNPLVAWRTWPDRCIKFKMRFANLVPPKRRRWFEFSRKIWMSRLTRPLTPHGSPKLSAAAARLTRGRSAVFPPTTYSDALRNL